MVDRMQKVLNRMSDKEKTELLAIVEEIESGTDGGYDIKKLKGYKDIYRVRKGKFRILYRREENGNTKVVAIERRGDTTYNLHNFL